MHFCYLKIPGHVVQSSDRFTMNNFYQKMMIISMKSPGNTSLEAALQAFFVYACSVEKFHLLN